MTGDYSNPSERETVYRLADALLRCGGETSRDHALRLMQTMAEQGDARAIQRLAQTSNTQQMS